MSAGTSLRVARLLAILRPRADEIVVAVDDRGSPDVVDAVATLADRVFTFPYADPVNRPRAWLHAQARSDWVLAIDDDEVPGADLLEALPALVAARDVTHYWVRRRWLYPRRSRYLAEPPWVPDYQLRLALNDPRLVRFPGEPHWPYAATGPGRYVSQPLYHAVCVLESRVEREERASRKSAGSGDKRVTGGAIDSVYFLPERRPNPATHRVPAEDRALVERVLAVDPSRATDLVSPRRTPPPARAATRQELDRLWAGRPLGEETDSIRLTLLEEAFPMRAGEQRAFDVLVENESDRRFDWGAEARPAVFASYHWRASDGRVVVYDGIRTPLPAALREGAAEIVPVQVVAPDASGSYVLELDLVHEGVRWFEVPVTCAVEVLGSDEEVEAWRGRAGRRALGSLAVRMLRRWRRPRSSGEADSGGVPQ